MAEIDCIKESNVTVTVHHKPGSIHLNPYYSLKDNTSKNLLCLEALKRKVNILQYYLDSDERLANGVKKAAEICNCGIHIITQTHAKSSVFVVCCKLLCQSRNRHKKKWKRE